MSGKHKKNKFAYFFVNYILNNKKEYIISTLLFFIGLIFSVILLNNASDDNIQQINTYFTNLISNVKENNNILYFELLKDSIISNVIIVLLLWIGASTIIGIPIVYGVIALKGFSIGYTICSIIEFMGIWKGILVSLSVLLLHNIILIPAITIASVSGVKLYKSIIKNKNRENAKFEILRHSVVCLLVFGIMFFSSLIEVYVSTNLLKITLLQIF